MKHKLIQNELTFYLSGELSSLNAEEVFAEMNAVIKKVKPTALALDCAKLKYISSAGLRDLVKLRSLVPNIRIVEVEPNVYHILEITGFCSIFSVSKALRKVEVNQRQLIGSGFCSKVYRTAPDTVIKVFHKADGLTDIERELSLAKQAFVHGIPTAISFDVVKVGDKYGAVFEMLNYTSLCSHYLDEPENYEALTDRYAALLKHINSTVYEGKDLPDFKLKYKQKLSRVEPLLSGAEKKKAKALFADLEDTHTFIHGDCHVKNILVDNEELLLIDMDTLGIGHPFFEYAALYSTYVAFEADDPGNVARFFVLDGTFSAKLFQDLMTRLGIGKADIQRIKALAEIHLLDWTMRNQPNNHARKDGCLKRLKALLA